jgi:hypothetical protein
MRFLLGFVNQGQVLHTQVGQRRRGRLVRPLTGQVRRLSSCSARVSMAWR